MTHRRFDRDSVFFSVPVSSHGYSKLQRAWIFPFPIPMCSSSTDCLKLRSNFLWWLRLLIRFLHLQIWGILDEPFEKPISTGPNYDNISGSWPQPRQETVRRCTQIKGVQAEHTNNENIYPVHYSTQIGLWLLNKIRTRFCTEPTISGKRRIHFFRI